MVAPAIPVALATADVAFQTVKFATKGIVLAIKEVYKIGIDINDFFNEHIENLKRSDNPTIARTGRVLEGAKAGFGIGFVTPVVIVAVGQLLLGNPLSAVKTVVAAATLTNPLALTCAAFGAIIYGWYALSEAERQYILEKISEGLEIGIELIKSILRYVIDTTKEILSSKQMQELKAYIGSVAATFGKSVGDVTHKLSDVVSDAVGTVKKQTEHLVHKTVDVTGEVYRAVSETAEKAAGSIRRKTPEVPVKTVKPEKKRSPIPVAKTTQPVKRNTTTSAAKKAAEPIKKSVPRSKEKAAEPAQRKTRAATEKVVTTTKKVSSSRVKK